MERGVCKSWTNGMRRRFRASIMIELSLGRYRGGRREQGEL
jgi:hypothetical protein